MGLFERIKAWFRGTGQIDTAPQDASAQADPVQENPARDAAAGDSGYQVEYENLAVPEIHTGKVDPDEPAQPAGDSAREFQAVPEYNRDERGL